MRAEPNVERMPVASIAPSLRKAVQAIDPDLPLQEIRTQQEQIDTSMQQERIIAALTASFGVLALVFASVGVYGVMAYSVAQRRSEIGIRMALGALPREVLTMVLREATWIALVGITCGIGATLHRRIADPQLKLQLGHETFEPACMPTGLHADAHGFIRTRKSMVELLRLVGMCEPFLLDLSGRGIEQSDLLKLGMEIYSYNDHRSTPFSRAGWVVLPPPTLPRVREPTLSWNQFHSLTEASVLNES
jgi:FtsX-like permease family protein